MNNLVYRVKSYILILHYHLMSYIEIHKLKPVGIGKNELHKLFRLNKIEISLIHYKTSLLN